MVHINGKDIDAAGQSLAAYLKANDYEMGTFVVECNEEIIHKEDYENYMLKDGDIIAITTNIPGLDVVHLGLACYEKGVLKLLHASSTQKMVVVSQEPLAQMLKRNKKFTGIRVLRIK